MLSIRKANPAVRVLAMTMICALCLVWVGAIQQRSNAIAGSLLLGAAGAAAAGSILPVVIGGTLLLALGVAFIDRDALITAAGRLGTALGDLFDRDMAASTVVQEPATGQYKLKTRIGDDTWAAARSWVAQQYDPGDVIADNVVVRSYNDWPSGDALYFTASSQLMISGSTSSGSYDLRLTYSSDGVFDYYVNMYQNGVINRPAGVSASVCPYVVRYDEPTYYGSSLGSTFRVYWGATSVFARTFAFDNTATLTGSSSLVAFSAPDIVDNPTYDYSNARSGAREIVVPLVAAAAGTANPDVSIDEDDKRKWVVPDVGIDNLVGAHPADVPAQDVGGVQVDEGVQVDSGAKTDAQTAIDAAAADETQSSLAGLFFSKFPFCIPFDVLQAFKLISAPAVAPRFEWDGLSTLPIEWHGSTKIVFDMGEERWQVVGQICRWTSLVGFCLALMLGTRRLMKW